MKKKISFVVLLIIIVATGLGFWYLSKPPTEKLSDDFKQAAVSDLLGRKAQLDAPDEKTGNTLFEGDYISFEYPARALEYTYRDPSSTGSSSAVMEDFIFQIKAPRMRFSYAVSGSPGVKSLDDIPAVKIRESRSYEYEKETLKIGNSQGLTFYKKGQEAEKSGFIIHNGLVYIFTTTGSSEEDVSKMYNDIVTSVKFK